MDVGEGSSTLALGIIPISCDCQLDRLAGFAAESTGEIGGNVDTLHHPNARSCRSGFRHHQMGTIGVSASPRRPDRIAVVPHISDGRIRKGLAEDAAADAELQFGARA